MSHSPACPCGASGTTRRPCLPRLRTARAGDLRPPRRPRGHFRSHFCDHLRDRLRRPRTKAYAIRRRGGRRGRRPQVDGRHVRTGYGAVPRPRTTGVRARTVPVARHRAPPCGRNPAGTAQTSPSRSAAAAASTGTVSGWGAPATAQSGSLRPLPVTVQTIR